MKINNFVFGIVILFSCSVFSQLEFENGYYINNNNEKINCLIKNIDWKNNPSDFSYKISNNDELKKLSVDEVREFGIGEHLRYLKAKVKIEKSVININGISNNSEKLKFSEETIFLKVLNEGSANLYSYEESNLIKFFFSVENKEIEQLIYSKYVDENNKLIENNGFRQQLLISLNCETINRTNIEEVRYSKKSLIKLFNKYNSCKDSNYKNSIKVDKRTFKEEFNLSLKLGGVKSELSVNKSPFEVLELNFDSTISLKYGLEIEFILPYNKNKWGFLIDPSYQKYKAQKNVVYTDLLSKTTNIYVDYQVLSVPLGIRYYSFLNDESKIFINVLYSINIDLKKELTSDNDLQLFEISSGGNFSAGFGYKYNDKFSLEFRNDFSRNITDYYKWEANFKSMSLIFGYTMF